MSHTIKRQVCRLSTQPQTTAPPAILGITKSFLPGRICTHLKRPPLHRIARQGPNWTFSGPHYGALYSCQELRRKKRWLRTETALELALEEWITGLILPLMRATHPAARGQFLGSLGDPTTRSC
ncbi:uncharacterized protein QC764_0112910 [Podospora pseudoanserina]|uniref:Uncharacterized protein n=1 Tax=Podospora pseudoanserina TaxID=2609844 RepID=A0ABR0HJM9_9PEZI|nr:hypothetical protein QC764_0112910 [Podospora pseudoanserina]